MRVCQPALASCLLRSLKVIGTDRIDRVTSYQWRITGFTNGGQGRGDEVERRRFEDRGADGGGAWGEVSPPHWGGL